MSIFRINMFEGRERKSVVADMCTTVPVQRTLEVRMLMIGEHFSAHGVCL